MNQKDHEEIVHSSHSHLLSFGTDKRFEVERCHVCLQYMQDFVDYYYCPKEECKYYLHIKCSKLKENVPEHHPIHPHHPLTLSFTIPNGESSETTQLQYECSFCRETKSRYFYHCGHHQCDFRIDVSCFVDFTRKGSALLRRFEFPHSLHDHKLSPLKPDGYKRYGHNYACNGCGVDTFGVPVLGCEDCSFYLHVPCSQVPKEMVHPFHPQHSLILLQKPPAEATGEELRCIACRKRIKDAFVLHCTDQCPFNLDIGCAFLKPSVKHDRHKHLLAHFEKIHLDDVRCIACNKVCDGDLFRCFACDFNIHSGCMSLPSSVDYDDHIHPLTLITSYREDDSNQYYCFVCEEIRDTDYGVYHCEECKLAAQIECVLPKESASEEIESSPEDYLDKSISKHREIEDKGHTTEVAEEEDIMAATSNETVSAEHTILLQLDVEVAKIREEVKALKKKIGEEVLEKLKELEEREAKAESMLIELKDKFYRN